MPIIGPGGGGGASVVTLAYQNTLSAPAASLDSGVIIPATGQVLEVFAMMQSTNVAAVVSLNMTFNNDSTAGHYDNQKLIGSSAAVSASVDLAAAALDVTIHGNSGTTTYPSTLRVVVPAYAATTFWKTAEWSWAIPDGTAGNNNISVYSGGWHSTAAISRVTLTPASGNLAAGSMMAVYIR